MNDKELIDLIEHYRWSVEPGSGDTWGVMSFDWIVAAPTLREALTKALYRQAWTVKAPPPSAMRNSK